MLEEFQVLGNKITSMTSIHENLKKQTITTDITITATEHP